MDPVAMPGPGMELAPVEMVEAARTSLTSSLQELLP